MRSVRSLFPLLIVLAALLVPASAAAQYARFDFPEYTINQSAPIPGGMYPMLAFPGVAVQLCSAWNSTACTALLQTYQSSSGTPCPIATQLVSPQPGSGCSAVTDATGDVGGFAAPGNYAYFVTTTQGTYGPYLFNVSAGGSYQATGLITDARTFGISASSTDAQNQAGFAALAAAVNAGTTPAHIYVPAPTAVQITAWSINGSNVATFTAQNTLVAGNVVLLRGFGTSNFFNNQPVTVATASATQFTANFTHSAGSSSEAGIAVPEYSVLSTGSTSLGVYNSAIDFECDSPDSTIINQTGTGYLIQTGPSGYVEFTSVNFWTPSFIHKCQFTGGASAAAGIYYPAGADGLIIEKNYFYNWGSSSNYAVLAAGSNELEMDFNSYLRTDQVLGNFVRQPFNFYNLLLFHHNRVVCTSSPTNGTTVPCGTGVYVSSNLEASHNLVSGPIPMFLGDGGPSSTISITDNLLEGAGSYLVEFGTPGGGTQAVGNLTVKNNRVELSSSSFGFVGPANASAYLLLADVSYNTLREDALTTLPALTLNNVNGNVYQVTANAGWPSEHNLGTLIPPATLYALQHDGSITVLDNGLAIMLSSSINMASEQWGANGSTSLPPVWGTSAGAFTVSSGKVYGNNAGNSIAYWNGGTFENDQASEITIGTPGTGSTIGPAIRLQTGSASGYFADCSSTQCILYKTTSGTKTQLGTTVTATLFAGEVIRLAVVGTNITLYLEGTGVETVSDATYTSGLPGIEASGTNGNMYASFWDTPGPFYRSYAQPYITGNGTATFAAGAGAGTSPGTPSCFSGYACDSKHGFISMTTGSATPTSGTVLTITLSGEARPSNAVCTIVAMNTSTGTLTPLYTANSTTTSCVGSAPGVSLTASQSYAFSYTVD